MATEQRLINVTEPLKLFRGWLKQLELPEDAGDKRGVESCIEILEDEPTVDARPVVHGRLGPIYKEAYYGEWADCLNCGTYNVLPCNYCRICGAQMDGGADNG